MRRREFITLLGGLVAAWPLAGCAQQRDVPLIGFLNTQSAGSFSHLVAGFPQGLREAGFIEGQNIQIEYRWAEGRYDRLPELANDLVHRGMRDAAPTKRRPASKLYYSAQNSKRPRPLPC